jgi:hypothetical protein
VTAVPVLPESIEGCRVLFVDIADGAIEALPLDALCVPFECGASVRSFPSYRGQRNVSGFYYAACTGSLVGFESWLERDEVMAMDFDPGIGAFALQPFRLAWVDGSGDRWHVPDFFARRADGTRIVVDCRPLDTGQVLSPNEMYSMLVAAAGYVPLMLGPDDYVELLPACWRVVNEFGVRIGGRT